MAYPSPETIFGYFLFFLPGVFSFFIYRFFSDKKLGKFDRVDFILVIFFTFLNKYVIGFKLKDGFLDYGSTIEFLSRIIVWGNYNPPEYILNLFILLLSTSFIGIFSDLIYRRILENRYRYFHILDKFGDFNADTVDTPIWESKLREEFRKASNDFSEANKIQVYLKNKETVDGYLTGFSGSDVEITHINYIEDERKLSYTEEWISKGSIERIKFLDCQVKDDYNFNSEKPKPKFLIRIISHTRGIFPI